MKIGFIGAGNMAEAIVAGMLLAENPSPRGMYIYMI